MDPKTEETSVPGIYVAGDVSRAFFWSRSPSGRARKQQLRSTRRSCAATASAIEPALRLRLLLRL